MENRTYDIFEIKDLTISEIIKKIEKKQILINDESLEFLLMQKIENQNDLNNLYFSIVKFNDDIVEKIFNNFLYSIEDKKFYNYQTFNSVVEGLIQKERINRKDLTNVIKFANNLNNEEYTKIIDKLFNNISSDSDQNKILIQYIFNNFVNQNKLKKVYKKGIKA